MRAQWELRGKRTVAYRRELTTPRSLQGLWRGRKAESLWLFRIGMVEWCKVLRVPIPLILFPWILIKKEPVRNPRPARLVLWSVLLLEEAGLGFLLLPGISGIHHIWLALHGPTGNTRYNWRDNSGRSQGAKNAHVESMDAMSDAGAFQKHLGLWGGPSLDQGRCCLVQGCCIVSPLEYKGIRKIF